MSTKIFNAYLFNGSKIELLGYLKSFVNDDENRTLLMNNMLKYDLQAYVNSLLIKSGGSVEKLGSLFQTLELSFFGEPYSFSQEYNINYDQNIVIYDTSKTKVKDKQLLQLFISKNSKLKNNIENNENFTEFDYTDQTDMDISKKEQSLRKKTWNIIFKEYSIPGVVGETYEIYNFLHDYLDNNKQVKQELIKNMNNMYKSYKEKNSIQNSLEIIEINLRCQEIRRLRKNEMNISDSENYGSISEYMSISRQATNEKNDGVLLRPEQEKLMKEIEIVSKFLPEQLPQVVIDSQLRRLDLVIQKTKESNQKDLKFLKEVGLENSVLKETIKLFL